MATFSEHILKLLNDYKRLLKRHLSITEGRQAIIDLGLTHKSLKFDTDVILHNKARCVVKDIESREALDRITGEYSSIHKFYQHLISYLANYQIENDAVIHITQKVSCALVEAVQIVSITKSELSGNQTSRLDDCTKIIEKFGTQDQRTLLADLLIDIPPSITR
jgi:hypothetical protein